MGSRNVLPVSKTGGSVTQTWQEETIQLVGDVISFWGFKENHGKIWALLYLHNRPFSTSEIRQYFQLSKGATSMLLQDLENWKVLYRDFGEERERHYKANSHFIAMIGNVLQQREGDLITNSIEQLTSLQQQAREDYSSPFQKERLEEMVELAELMKQVVQLSNKMKKRNISELSKINNFNQRKLLIFAMDFFIVKRTITILALLSLCSCAGPSTTQREKS